jgi:hypothetical protein
MKPTLLRSLLPPALLSVGLAAACALPAATASDAPEPVELRTYSIPPGYESQAPSMLRSALGTDVGGGRVSVGPAGKVLVLASPAVQRGVEKFFAELQAAGPPPAAPQPVHVTYWFVLGVPDPALDGFAVTDGSRLAEIEAALGQIAQSQGPQRFKLLERVQLSSAGDEWAQAGGNQAMVQQRATRHGDIVLSDIQVTLQNHRLQTQVKLEPEQIVVLAQTGVGKWAQTSDFPAENLYYIVTSRIE